MKEITFKDSKASFRSLNIIFSCRNMSKLRIKYQSYPNSTKIDAFEQKNMHMSQPY